MTTTIILELSTLVVVGVIGYFVGAHNASSAKKQQKEIAEKLEEVKATITDKTLTS